MDMNFRQMLADRQEKVNSLVCVGLDPLLEKMPQDIRKAFPIDKDAVTFWMRQVVDATAEYASMFKPQRAHWEAIEGGVEALRAIVFYIQFMYPDILVFLDCKRGDIDRTQQQYREAHFALDRVDGINYN